MSIEERFYKIIVSSLGVERDQINDETGPGDIPQWDSLGHQGLLTVLEKEFGFVFTIDEVLDMETVEEIIEIIERHIS